MRSSRWQAQGNVYLVAEGQLDAELVRSRVGDADGILEVRARGARLARDRDLESRRVARRDVRQRHADRGPVARGAHRRDRGARPGRPAHGRRPDAPGRPGRAGPRRRCASASRTRWRGSGSRPSTSATRMRSSKATRPSSTASGRCSRPHPRFPNRTNVQVARRVDPGTIEARVWERGVGETGASGTSAVAVVAALGGGAATVRFPGGDLHVQLDGGRARLTGPAERTGPPEPLS